MVEKPCRSEIFGQNVIPLPCTVRVRCCSYPYRVQLASVRVNRTPLGRFFLPYLTEYDRKYHAPLGRLSLLDISTVGLVSGAKKIGVGNISPKAFERRIIQYWHPLDCRAIELGKTAPGGCDIPGAPSITVGEEPSRLLPSKASKQRHTSLRYTHHTIQRLLSPHSRTSACV